jgi:hypothetical protein
MQVINRPSVLQNEKLVVLGQPLLQPHLMIRAPLVSPGIRFMNEWMNFYCLWDGSAESTRIRRPNGHTAGEANYASVARLMVVPRLHTEVV